MMKHEITIVRVEMVKYLREITGCGMMDCKKALEKNEWDILDAKKYLDEKEEMLKWEMFKTKSRNLF